MSLDEVLAVPGGLQKFKQNLDFAAKYSIQLTGRGAFLDFWQDLPAFQSATLDGTFFRLTHQELPGKANAIIEKYITGEPNILEDAPEIKEVILQKFKEVMVMP